MTDHRTRRNHRSNSSGFHRDGGRGASAGRRGTGAGRKGTARREETEADEELSRIRHKLFSFICDDIYVPMKAKELEHLLDVPADKKEIFERALDDLVAMRKIEVNEQGRYRKSTAAPMEGTFIANAKGFGFVTVEGQDEDYFVPRDYVGGAFHGDLVQISIVKRGDDQGHRAEAKVTRILSRGITSLVGSFELSRQGTFGFVEPDLRKIPGDIFIPASQTKNAITGDKVLVSITDYGAKDKGPEGAVTEIIGHKGDRGVDVLSTLRAYEIPMDFPEPVLEEADRLAIPVPKEEIARRRDLRKIPMVTIDGEDSKDLDDAVSLEREGDGYLLGVHIADVSHYVRENSALDKEALKRGTSVYVVDRVVPMLPTALSNGMCSLNEGEDRLTLSCLMHLNSLGQVVDYEILESVVNIDRRMTYTKVQAVLDEDPKALRDYDDFADTFRLMLELSEKIRAIRTARGAIDFDFPETDIILDENGRAVDLRQHPRNQATMLIEDFMLSANESVAREFARREIPFLYRTHDKPDAERLRNLKTYLGALGYVMHSDPQRIRPIEIQNIMTQIAGKPEEKTISTIVLRSMQQAKYTTDSIGHFGLAAKYYCHFTSPIRRYPDLIIHRIIKENLAGKFSPERAAHYEDIMPTVAVETSRLERRAVEIERDVDRMKKVEYMEGHVGETYDGCVSGVTGWGLYVELPNSVEGLIPVSTLTDDYYEFSEDTYELIGERFHRHFKLGQSVRVLVSSVDARASTIDFELIG